MSDRPIKMHLDEPMRAQIEFVLRRRLAEIGEQVAFGIGKRHPEHRARLNKERELTETCLKEACEAGT